MKIILSRKGFDSGSGGQPSPILPGGTLLSLPIPSKNDIYKFADLYHEGKSYFQIIDELKQNNSIKTYHTCHLDPDIRHSILKRKKNWKPIFGQANAAQGHLRKNNVSVNDIFLFYGWFKQAEITGKKYSYVKGSPDLHIIYGYFQIGEIVYHGQDFPEYSKYHPHAGKKFQEVKSNCIYIANDNLTLNKDYPGAGNMKFRDNLILTKEGMSRSKWKLPDILRDLTISYHTKKSFKQGYFQSAAKGQEFVIEANDDLINWVLELITTNSS